MIVILSDVVVTVLLRGIGMADPSLLREGIAAVVPSLKYIIPEVTYRSIVPLSAAPGLLLPE